MEAAGVEPASMRIATPASTLIAKSFGISLNQNAIRQG